VRERVTKATENTTRTADRELGTPSGTAALVTADAALQRPALALLASRAEGLD